MTCAHVLGLIDAGPFAAYPQEHLDAARDHARDCPTCGPALALSTALTTELTMLPEPEAPANLAGIVMARIAQLPESNLVPIAVSTPGRRDWAHGVTALGGLVAGLAVVLTMPNGASVLGEFVTPRLIASGGMATMPASGAAALAIFAGLVLYTVGLFAPLRSERS